MCLPSPSQRWLFPDFIFVSNCIPFPSPSPQLLHVSLSTWTPSDRYYLMLPAPSLPAPSLPGLYLFLTQQLASHYHAQSSHGPLQGPVLHEFTKAFFSCLLKYLTLAIVFFLQHHWFLESMGSFSVHFTIFCLKTKQCPSSTLPAIPHFYAPFSWENYPKTVVCTLVYTSSCSTHSFTLSSGTSTLLRLLVKVLSDFHIVKNHGHTPILALLVFKWDLAGLTSSSLKQFYCWFL